MTTFPISNHPTQPT